MCQHAILFLNVLYNIHVKIEVSEWHKPIQFDKSSEKNFI